MQEPLTSHELSQTRIKTIQRSRQNFSDLRKFLKERELIKRTSTNVKRQAALIAAESHYHPEKASSSPEDNYTSAAAAAAAGTSASVGSATAVSTDEAYSASIDSKTDAEMGKEQTKEEENDIYDPLCYLPDSKVSSRGRWSTPPPPPALDHESLSLLLHESALNEVHRRLAAIEKANCATTVASAKAAKAATAAAAAVQVPVEFWILRVAIDSAKSLRNADGFGDLSDPYAIVLLNNNEICRTLTIHDNLSPSWDFDKDVHLTMEDLGPYKNWSDCTLSVEVYDEDISSDDDFLGCVTFTGADLMTVMEGGRQVHKLGNRSKEERRATGRIDVSFNLIEQKDRPVFEQPNDSDSDDDYDDDESRVIGFMTPDSSKDKKRRAEEFGSRIHRQTPALSPRRSSLDMAKSRRKASAMSHKDVLALETGDVSLSWLMSVPLFADLTPQEINALRDALEPEDFKNGDIIIQEGNRNASKFFVIQTGDVEIYKTIDGTQKLVNTMTAGQTFGERALLIEGEARAATCMAKGNVACLVLAREVFAAMLGSSTTLIDENYKPGRGNDPDAAGLTRHVERFSELMKWFLLATEQGDRDNILEAGLCLELHKLFSPELRPKDIIERTISTMYSMFDAVRVGFFLIDHEAQEMILVVSPTARYLKLPLAGIAGSVAKSGKFENIRDAYQDPRFNQSMDKQTGFKTNTMVACPLKNKEGVVIAVIQLINKKKYSEYESMEEEVNGQESKQSSKKSPRRNSNFKLAASAVLAAARFDKNGKAARFARQARSQTSTQSRSSQRSRRSSHLLDSLEMFQKSDQQKKEAVELEGKPARTGTSISAQKGRGGRIIRGRTIDDARKRKKKEFDTKPVLWPTFTQDDAKLLMKIAEQLEPIIIAAREVKTETEFKNLRKLDCSLMVQVQHVENLCKFVRTGKKDKETGLRTGPVQVDIVPPGRKIEVTIAVYHGEKMLHDPCTTSLSLSDENGRVDWHEQLMHSIMLSHLPRATRLIFTVHKPGKGPTGLNKPYGWGGISAMDFRDALVSGTHRLRLWPGACHSPTVPILQPVEDSKAAGFLFLKFPSFGQEVRFYDVDAEELGEACQEIGMSQRQRTRAKVDRRQSEKRFFVDLSGLSSKVMLDPELHRIIYHTALTELTKDEQKKIWYARDKLTKIPMSLPKVLLSVEWDQPHIVSEMHTLLYMWERMESLQALQLLDSRFPDPKVRAYAVQLLDELPDEHLRPYLLQLVQCLKHEAYHDSALSRFLVCRAVQSADQIGHILYWLLKSEVHIDVVRDRFSLILAEYLRAVEPEVRTELGHQGFVMRRLVAIAKDVNECEGGKAARKKLLHERLRATALPATFQLPLSPDVICDGIRIEECRVMDSKKKPLWLVFDAIEWRDVHNNDEGEPLRHFKFPVLFKAGDDLRQDQLTLQLLSIMDNVWKTAGMDFQLSPYAAVATGDQIGFLEVVQHSTTLASVVKEGTSLDRGKKGLMARFSAAKKAVYNRDYIKVWLEAEAKESFRSGIVLNPLLLSDRQNRDHEDKDNKAELGATAAQTLIEFNRRFMLSCVPSSFLLFFFLCISHIFSFFFFFLLLLPLLCFLFSLSLSFSVSLFLCLLISLVSSCAGYCVATFILGIGDRHNDNIMITRGGRFFHIDFGHFLGNFKSKYGIKRERAPFVFTNSMVEALGGTESALYLEFVEMCGQALNIIRQKSSLLISLFRLMISCGIPELEREDDIIYLRDKLMLEKTDEEAAAAFAEEIVKSAATKTTRLNDAAHIFKHG